MSKVVIPFDSLSTDALEGIITEFVSREGTEYGEHEVALESKIDTVKAQLRAGTAVIVFDQDLDSANIVPADTIPP